MREDVIGRANVEDTPELDRYYNELGQQESYALWTVANAIEPWEPKPASQPIVWRYDAMRPLVMKALDMVSPEKAGRRVIALENPGRKGLSACVGWLYTGLQVMRPGEFASAHNHASAALRFIMEGAGAYTVVDGHKMSLSAGDFVITPNGTWHDHGVEKDGAVTVWQDGLDMLLVSYKGAGGVATALVSGEVSVAFVAVPPTVSFVKNGQLRALAVRSPKRLELLPDVPSMAELGFPDLTNDSWQGFFVGKRTPPHVVALLNNAARKTLADAKVVERLKIGAASVIDTETPEKCTAFVKEQTAFWSKLVKQVGLEGSL